MNNNDALMTRARHVNPVRAGAFDDLARSAEAQEVLVTILHSPLRASVSERLPARPRSRRLRSIALRAAVVTLAAAAVVGVTTFESSDPPQPDNKTIWSAHLVSVAERSPRMLLDEQVWRVTRADEFDAHSGEMTFENGRDCDRLPVKKGCYWVSLSWRPAATHNDYFQDRKRGADASSVTSIDGHDAAVFAVHDTPFGTTFQAMWLAGDHSLELRSDLVPGLEEFDAIASTLHEVDVDRWLSALPAGVVKPVDRAAAVDRITADIPVPSTVDLDELRYGQSVRDNYAFDYQVTQTIVCGWIQQWIDGRRAGDESAMRRAVDALAGSRNWSVMARYGGASTVFDVAEAMSNGAPVNGDVSLPTGVGYQRHVGCPES